MPGCISCGRSARKLLVLTEYVISYQMSFSVCYGLHEAIYQSQREKGHSRSGLFMYFAEPTVKGGLEFEGVCMDPHDLPTAVFCGPAHTNSILQYQK